MAYQFRETSNVKVELINVYIDPIILGHLNAIANFEGVSRSKLLSLYLKGGGNYDYIIKQIQKRNKKILLRHQNAKQIKKAVQKAAYRSECLPYFADTSTHRELSAQ